VEALEPAVVFGVPKDRLDDLFALAVELVSELGREHRPHPVVAATGPAGSRGVAFA